MVDLRPFNFHRGKDTGGDMWRSSSHVACGLYLEVFTLARSSSSVKAFA